jgi:succinate dehydrogenase hydrophobic anchor subunit
MSAIGLPVWGYGLLLGVTAAMSLAVESRVMIRVSLALLTNWFAHMAWWMLTADPTPYIFSAVVDTATAVIVLTRPAGRMQALIGWSLLIQITIHFAYGLHVVMSDYSADAELKYWAWLDWIALVQIVLAGGWTIGGTGRHLLGYPPDGDRNRADAHDSAGVVGP